MLPALAFRCLPWHSLTRLFARLHAAGTGLSEPLPDAVLENMDIKTEKPGVSSSLPRQIQVQLRERGIEMALAGEAGFDPAWLIGEAIDAVFSEDGGWYPARVIGTSGPNYIVEFDGCAELKAVG